MKKRNANIVLIGVALIWGGGFLATDMALDAISPFYIMMIRFLGAALFPLLFCWKKLRTLEIHVIGYGLVTGMLLFLAFAFQTYGLKYSSPSKSAFLTAANVVFIPYLLWYIMKRRPLKKEIIASILCLLGIAMLTLKPGSFRITLGDMLSLICALFFALHIIALERYGRHVDTLSMTTLQLLCAGAFSLICALCLEEAPTAFSIKIVGNILYLVFISTLLAYLFQTYAQTYTTANSASLILSTEAIFASIFSFFLLQETMSLVMFMGACLIFFSILYIEYTPKSNHMK